MRIARLGRAAILIVAVMMLGRLKHHDEKAAGALKLKGSFSGGCSGGIGALPWTAKRAGT